MECGLLRGRRVQGLKWYNDHCRPCLAMIVDLFVLPGLCFQSLSTFYCRFHCRPLKHFGLSVSHQTRKLWPLCVCVEHKQTRMKWTVWSKYGLWREHAQWRLQKLQYFDFRPLSTKQCSENTVRPKPFCFHIRIHPCLICWQHTYTTILDGLPGPWGRV